MLAVQTFIIKIRRLDIKVGVNEVKIALESGAETTNKEFIELVDYCRKKINLV